MSKTESLTGVVASVWRKPGSDWCIVRMESEEVTTGCDPEMQVIPGLTMRFFGVFKDNPQYGRQMEFRAFSVAEPHSRRGMVLYLQKFAPGVGPVIAGQLFDIYRDEACRILRTNPEQVARDIPRLTLERAREAAAALQEISELEDVKIDLANLFAGRGFPGAMVEQVIRKFGPLAPQRIKRDPFTLLVGEFSGAGFARCDRLYMDLGLSPGRLKRQMICLWHILKTDNDGHTWFLVSSVESRLQQHISGVRVNLRKAVRLGIKSGWLAVRKQLCRQCGGSGHDEKSVRCLTCNGAGGSWWIADGKKAANERTIAERVKLLMEGLIVLPRFTEALPGECDSTPDYSIEEIDGRLEQGNDLEFDTEALAAIGRKIGICQFCSRKLTNPISRQYGYGPHCAQKWNLPYEVPSEIQETCLTG